MKLKLKGIAPIQAGKMLGAFYGLFSLLIVPFMFVAMAMGGLAARSQGAGAAPAMPLMLGMGAGFALVIPFLYAALGFVFGALAALLYNWLSRWLGGLELDFEASEPPMA